MAAQQCFGEHTPPDAPSTEPVGSDIAMPPSKLDLRYFTDPERCPRMVRHGARRAFELFLYLANGFLKSSGQPQTPTHEELCAACGLDPRPTASRPAISRLLRQLRDAYHVIDFVPARRRRPQIVLRPPDPAGDPLNPPRYVYFGRGWAAADRQTFDALGTPAFAAEYMYFVSEFEASMAREKHGRAYWYYPLERIAAAFHISSRFAAVGLRALVDLGVMNVRYADYPTAPPRRDVVRANRFYFLGLGELERRKDGLRGVEARYPAEFPMARQLAAVLANGQTVKNVHGLCELVAEYGTGAVSQVVASLAKYRRRNPRRRLEYVQDCLRRTPVAVVHPTCRPDGGEQT